MTAAQITRAIIDHIRQHFPPQQNSDEMRARAVERECYDLNALEQEVKG